MPAAPPRIATDPAIPLWKLRGRGFSRLRKQAGLRDPGARRHQLRSPEDPDPPPRSRRNGPGPSSVSRPGLSAMKVTVCVARTAHPSTRPVSACSPLGMSSASTGQRWRFAYSTSAGVPAGDVARQADAEQAVDEQCPGLWRHLGHFRNHVHPEKHLPAAARRPPARRRRCCRSRQTRGCPRLCRFASARRAAPPRRRRAPSAPARRHLRRARCAGCLATGRPDHARVD